MAISAVIGAWLAGLLGGLHCIAMCGGFLTAIAGSGVPAAAQGKPLLPARLIARRQLTYNLGRIATYASLGALVGSAGALTMASAAALLPVQRALFVVANLFLLGLAFGIAGKPEGASWLQRMGATMFGRLLPLARPLLLRHTAPARFATGMLWGFVPCALTYSVLPVALFAGGAWQGATVMLAFGLGTLPNLLVAGVAIARTTPWFEARPVRLAAAALLAGFAALGIWRAFAAAPSLSHGPFCF
jgi:sulfite exporter TauE/SafE